MDSLHKGGGFKTIYMRKGAIEKNLEKKRARPLQKRRCGKSGKFKVQ